jgi:FlaA1/EpsC-like NDP-sugar epimerase
MTYKRTIRHLRAKDYIRITGLALLKIVFGLLLVLAFINIDSVNWDYFFLFILVDFLLTLAAIFGVRMIMVVTYELLMSFTRDKCENILIYGIDEKSVSLEMRLRNSKHYFVCGFFIYGHNYKSYKISGKSVYNFKTEQDFINIINKKHIKAIIFAKHNDVQTENERLIGYCEKHSIKTLITPNISDDISGRVNIRKVKIEDLLGRDEIDLDMDHLKKNFNDKVIFVTGAAGSIGSEICRQLSKLEIKQLILFDIAETPLHNIRIELETKFPKANITCIIGDIRVKERLEMVFKKYLPEIVIHAAAYKHVPLMEENPCEAVLVNVVGTKNVADMAVKFGVKKMIVVSTDKAVNPTNIMGATKRLAEIYVQSLGSAIEQNTIESCTSFVTTRFGNVLGSNGSVIPHFRKQIENGGPVTVTHPDIIRYFMTIPEACRLVLEAAIMNETNKIFAFEMGDQVKIIDLAKRMIMLSGLVPNEDIKIEFIGLRPGEKLYEEVLNNEEDTIPTEHKKIKIANVRKYKFKEIINDFEKIESLSRKIEIDETVRLMKMMVPEYKSQNSEFTKFDN